MNTYLVVKTLHILSATLMVGTGFGTAFYLFFANRSGNVQAQAVVSRLVCRADWWFTTPAVIFQPLSGLWMIRHTGMDWSMSWIVWTLALYSLAGLCWLPVVVLQLRMAKTAQAAAERGERTLPDAYWRDARRWELLGYPAFCAMVIVYFLMVLKPV
ncbi:MAG: DUF2269 domain-containing protein [Eikenella sp.]|nr:DUF2269 domain-containing protein [Eikenella sp.]